MALKIGQFLGRTVLVSIPTLFDDGVCRPYTLVGAELQGLWLQSDDLNGRLLSDEMRDFAEQATPVVFVPFAHIAGVMVPSALLAPAPPAAPQAPAAKAASPAAKAASPAGAKPTRSRRRTTQAKEQG